MSDANKTQVGGKHYESTVQHWDMAAWHFGRGYFKGQITKYVYRWRKKGGKQDLEKALHFTRKLMELDSNPPPASVEEFIACNGIPEEEATIIRLVTYELNLTKAADMLEALIAAEPSAGYVNQS